MQVVVMIQEREWIWGQDWCDGCVGMQTAVMRSASSAIAYMCGCVGHPLTTVSGELEHKGSLYYLALFYFWGAFTGASSLI